jgi:hypothetical protein
MRCGMRSYGRILLKRLGGADDEGWRFLVAQRSSAANTGCVVGIAMPGDIRGILTQVLISVSHGK